MIGSSLVTYRMTVHLFGGVWSPSCAAYALHRTAEDNEDKFSPEVVRAIHDNFYVDDCLISCSDEESAISLVKDLSKMTEAGGFHLTKWISNSRQVLHCVDECDRSKAVIGLEPSDELPVDRVLGICWNTEKGLLTFKISLRERVCTRRGVLSTMSSIFDPIGMVVPFVLVAKRILQSETRLKKDWDEVLVEANRELWMKWLRSVCLLESFTVERYSYIISVTHLRMRTVSDLPESCE